MDPPSEDSPKPSLTRGVEFYRLVLENLPVAVIAVDPGLRITDYNPWAECLTGYKAHEAIGQLCGDIIKGSMCGTKCPLKTVINREKPSVETETTIKTKDGQTVPVLLNTAAFYDERGSLTGALECFVDISYQKKLERERANIMSMLAHDMKSPLVVIQGFILRLLGRDEVFEDEKFKTQLEIIKEESAKLEDLVSDFLDFSRIQSDRLVLSYSATAPDKELLELINAYRAIASKRGIRLEMRHGESSPVIVADSKRLRRVFENLLDNAVKFSPDNGKVTIITEDTPDEVRISFIDRGIGIGEEELPLIFDSFYRTPSALQMTGHGMGLAVVKAIVESHGGKVLVESEPGKGSTFTVVLPKR